MNSSFDFRPLLAALVLLAVLAGAYEAAVRGPLSLPPPLAAPLATPDRLAAAQTSEAAALDSAIAAPAPMGQQVPTDTTIHFTAYDSLAGDTLAPR